MGESSPPGESVCFLGVSLKDSLPNTKYRMDTQRLLYNSWEAKHLAEHSLLMEKYRSLKQKEEMVLANVGVKANKKDTLLNHKANNTLSKLGNAELLSIQKEEDIEASYRRNIQTITQRREKRLKEAEDEFERAQGYYTSERDASLSKCKREFDAKKRMLESQGEYIEQTRNLDIKSLSEITLEKQKQDILKQLKNSITIMQMSRSQLPTDSSFDTTVPTLPENLLVTSTSSQPSQEVKEPVPIHTNQETKDMPSWLVNIGEDASLVILRAESKREDARLRREAEEEEMQREERKLQYRKQLEEEAEERRRKRHEEENQESDSENFEEELAAAKARQAAITKARKDEQEDSSFERWAVANAFPPTITDTKAKKPIKTIRR